MFGSLHPLFSFFFHPHSTSQLPNLSVVSCLAVIFTVSFTIHSLTFTHFLSNYHTETNFVPTVCFFLIPPAPPAPPVFFRFFLPRHFAALLWAGPTMSVRVFGCVRSIIKLDFNDQHCTTKDWTGSWFAHSLLLLSFHVILLFCFVRCIHVLSSTNGPSILCSPEWHFQTLAHRKY